MVSCPPPPARPPYRTPREHPRIGNYVTTALRVSHLDFGHRLESHLSGRVQRRGARVEWTARGDVKLKRDCERSKGLGTVFFLRTGIHVAGNGAAIRAGPPSARGRRLRVAASSPPPLCFGVRDVRARRRAEYNSYGIYGVCLDISQVFRQFNGAQRAGRAEITPPHLIASPRRPVRCRTPIKCSGSPQPTTG
ncbi:hypothetical protein EVAR_14627_1 [Eumeta japonica]|uniref:Uncharacterized protein n=1 Tax=Eumeta variegata TaxID=151549 RepID=A0A4C1U299_EUMVA|nr:hypothetical protein EVAR_14627_1 [Eumeta japonica]